jgi:hypothetical protein
VGLHPGSKPVRLDLTYFDELFFGLWVHIRRSGLTPLQWHRSRAIPLNKSGLSNRPQDKRLIHVLDPIGKCWLAGLSMRKLNELPSTHHGFARGRRREAAFMVQQIAAWKLHKQGFSWTDCLHDMTNAFGSSLWDKLYGAIDELMKPEDRIFGSQRIEWDTMQLAREVSLRPVGQGGFMGDPFVVQCFAHTFKRPVSDWQQ